jgi:hypothetical protein
MWSEPVTFGGGITSENMGRIEFSSASNKRLSTHSRAHRNSISEGL